MATPLKCTQNSLFHIDYGTPLLASKSTDYRSSTAKNHSFIPNIPQEFDCVSLLKKILSHYVYPVCVLESQSKIKTRTSPKRHNSTKRLQVHLQCRIHREEQYKLFQWSTSHQTGFGFRSNPTGTSYSHNISLLHSIWNKKLVDF